MFRRSLIALAIATGIVLLVVVVYAGFNQNGPELALGRAADDIRAGAYKRAIVDLDRAEHSTAMQRRDLRLQLLQLRYRAHKQLDGYRAALRDLEALLQLDDRPEATLLLDRIWLLARLED